MKFNKTKACDCKFVSVVKKGGSAYTQTLPQKKTRTHQPNK